MKPSRFAPALALCASLLVLAACGNSPTSSEPTAAQSGPAKGKTGTVDIAFQVGKVGALSKLATISLRKLVLVAIGGGDKPDTVRDTVALNGGYGQQLVKRSLKLKPKANWTLFAKTLDARDSIIHEGASPAFAIQLADTTHVTLVLQSKFTMYTATFDNLPTSVGTSDDKADRIGVAITRLVLKVDGVTKADSTAPEWFGPTKAVVLAFDYVPVGKHEFTLEAYGKTNIYTGILYTGAATFSTVAGEDGSRPVTLTWVGPNSGVVDGNIIVGKIGTIDLKPKFPDSI